MEFPSLSGNSQSTITISLQSDNAITIQPIRRHGRKQIKQPAIT